MASIGSLRFPAAFGGAVLSDGRGWKTRILVGAHERSRVKWRKAVGRNCVQLLNGHLSGSGCTFHVARLPEQP
jgi:hypothetical protein